MRKGVENIREINCCLKKIGLVSLTEIIDSFISGEADDECLLEALRDWQINFEEIIEDEIPPIARNITFMGGIYRPNLITSAEKGEKVNFMDNSLNHTIIFNKCNEEKNVPYANKTFLFNSITERDKQLKILQEKLVILGVRFY